MITKLIFPDGREISSGQTPAVMGLQLTRSVSNGRELNPGACCSAMAQLTIFGLDSLPDNTFRLQRISEDETRELGVFHAQQPEKSGRLLKVTAYDNLCLLDKDMTGYDFSLPCSLYQLASRVVEGCGLTLKNADLPSGDYRVEPFGTVSVTGRQLLQWIGALCGGFWRADPEGLVEFAWYAPTDTALTADDYYQGSLTLAAYDAQPIEKVQLKKTAADVGVVWPNLTGGAAYINQGNPLFTDPQVEVAQTLFQRIGGISYAPCQVTMPECGIAPGDLITVDGRTVAVMTTRLQNGRLTIQATGSPSRTGTAAVNELSFKNLSGKVLELTTRVDGLTVANKSGAGELAQLALSVEGLQTTVSRESADAAKRLTVLEQTARELSLQVRETAREVTTSTGYSFGAEGLHIARSGSQMVNRLDHTGMYVERAGQLILQASSQGVTATDVQVNNYLNIGSARFEELGDRTACFYLGNLEMDN